MQLLFKRNVCFAGRMQTSPIRLFRLKELQILSTDLLQSLRMESVSSPCSKQYNNDNITTIKEDGTTHSVQILPFGKHCFQLLFWVPACCSVYIYSTSDSSASYIKRNEIYCFVLFVDRFRLMKSECKVLIVHYTSLGIDLLFRRNIKTYFCQLMCKNKRSAIIRYT